MKNEVNVFSKLKKQAPEELDSLVKKRIRKYKIQWYGVRFASLFLIFFALGVFLALKVNIRGMDNLRFARITVHENPHNKVYPGVVPVKLSIEPSGDYNYKIFVNGMEYREGYVENDLEDSVIINDPYNDIEVEITDPVNDISHYVSWVVFNF
ncbi:MAG: hypothetical protein ACPLN0_04815 [Candidatus Hydrothermia bacterium]|jgi:hypothetical protein